MSPFGSVPPHALVDAAEKYVATLDETDLASVLANGLSAMPAGPVGALVGSVFGAFRARGESSEDVIEGAGTSLDALERGEGAAVAALLEYARANPGLLRESIALYAEQHSDMVQALPPSLRDGVAARIAARSDGDS
jgi:hypothetical protein